MHASPSTTLLLLTALTGLVASHEQLYYEGSPCEKATRRDTACQTLSCFCNALHHKELSFDTVQVCEATLITSLCNLPPVPVFPERQSAPMVRVGNDVSSASAMPSSSSSTAHLHRRALDADSEPDPVPGRQLPVIYKTLTKWRTECLCSQTEHAAAQPTPAADKVAMAPVVDSATQTSDVQTTSAVDGGDRTSEEAMAAAVSPEQTTPVVASGASPEQTTPAVASGASPEQTTTTSTSSSGSSSAVASSTLFHAQSVPVSSGMASSSSSSSSSVAHVVMETDFPTVSTTGSSPTGVDPLRQGDQQPKEDGSALQGGATQSVPSVMAVLVMAGMMAALML